ncbi:MAG: hypothetical protein K6U89_05085 [Chloroflexi bacterium]|jgi:hypothetical protein|nr:hypothetical protein [Chloroflexota bacterium]
MFLFALPWLVASTIALPAVCPASGTLRLEPAIAVPGAPVTLRATVDSPDEACRALVRSEPFVIMRSPQGERELSLQPQGEQFQGQLTLPPPPWSITLYVVGTGEPLATVASQPVETVADLMPYLRRSPGAVLIGGGAVVLALLAVLGLPARRARPRRLPAARQPLPPAAEPPTQVGGTVVGEVKPLATPAALPPERLGSTPATEVRSQEAPDR